MTTPLDSLIDQAMRCIRCGTQGIGNCACFERCSCGWWAERAKPCRNPQTHACSTKVKYGTYNRKSRRYE